VDLRACIDAPLTVAPNEVHLISSGLAIHLEDRGLAAVVLRARGSATATGSCSAT